MQLINLLMERSSREISPKVTTHSGNFPSKYIHQLDNFSLKKIPKLGANPHTAHKGGAPPPPGAALRQLRSDNVEQHEYLAATV